jgi:hypothetical protein
MSEIGLDDDAHGFGRPPFSRKCGIIVYNVAHTKAIAFVLVTTQAQPSSAAYLRGSEPF